MATRIIEVIVKVKSGDANRKLGGLARKIKGAGKAAKKSSVDFKQFNRTLFATTAFIGTFLKTFSSLGTALNMGAELDRVDNQFERVLGPSSKMLLNIRNLTDATVSSMDAMKAGIALANSGITSGSEETAKLIAMSAVAARRAGIDTSEGIKRVLSFVKKGSVASLEFLNLARTTDPAFTARIELMKKVGGALGGTLSIQEKYTMGMRLLDIATRGQMKGFRDQADVIKGLSDSWDIFRRTLGRFIGTALGPLIDKFTDLFYRMSAGLADLRKNNKEIVFLAKAILVTTGAVLGLAGAIGTLRLSIYSLNALGLGLPKLLFLAGSLVTIFLGLTNNVSSMTDKLKVFGGFIKGIFQLVTSFDPETGISKIDVSLKKLLKDNHIYNFAKNVARSFIWVKKTVEDFIGAFKNLAKWIDHIAGGAFGKIIESLSSDKPWQLKILSDESGAKSNRMVGALAGLAGLGIALKGLGFLKNLFTRRPKGTITDPIFTVGTSGPEGLVVGALKSKTSLITKIGAGVIGTLIAAEVGWAIGNELKDLGQEVNKYGQKSSYWERLFGRVVAATPGTDFTMKDWQDTYGEAPTAPNLSQIPGTKTSQVNIPPKDNTREYLADITEHMRVLDTAQQKKLNEATSEALATGPEGRARITDDEMRKLSVAFGIALDNSIAINGIKDNTKQSTNVPGPIRGK